MKLISSNLLKLGLIFFALFGSENLREFYASHFLGQILVCAYTSCQHCSTLISCISIKDYLSHPVIPAPIFLLCPLAAFAYYVIDFFITITS